MEENYPPENVDYTSQPGTVVSMIHTSAAMRLKIYVLQFKNL